MSRRSRGRSPSFDQLDFNIPNVPENDPPFYEDLAFCDFGEDHLEDLGYELALRLINPLKSRDTDNPLRVFMFNKFAANDFDNDDFVSLFRFASQSLTQANYEENNKRRSEFRSDQELVAFVAESAITLRCGVEYDEDRDLQDYCDFPNSIHDDLMDAARGYDELSRNLERAYRSNRSSGRGGRAESTRDTYRRGGRDDGRRSSSGRSYSGNSGSGRNYSRGSAASPSETGLIRNGSTSNQRSEVSNSGRNYSSNREGSVSTTRTYGRGGHDDMHRERTRVVADTGNIEELDENDNPVPERSGRKSSDRVARTRHESTNAKIEYISYKGNEDQWHPADGACYIPLYDETSYVLMIAIEPGKVNRLVLHPIPKEENVDLAQHARALGVGTDEVTLLGKVLENDPQSYEGFERERMERERVRAEIEAYTRRNEKAPETLVVPEMSYDELGAVECEWDGQSMVTTLEQALVVQTNRKSVVINETGKAPVAIYGRYSLLSSETLNADIKALYRDLSASRTLGEVKLKLSAYKTNFEQAGNELNLAFIDQIDGKITKAINQAMLERLNSKISISSFLSTYDELGPYMVNKYGSEVWSMFFLIEPRIIRSLFWSVDDATVETFLKSVIGLEVVNEDGTVAVTQNDVKIDPNLVEATIVRSETVYVADIQVTLPQVGLTQLNNRYRILTDTNTVAMKVFKTLTDKIFKNELVDRLVVRTMEGHLIEISRAPVVGVFHIRKIS